MNEADYSDILFTDWGMIKNTTGNSYSFMNLYQRAKIFLPFSALTGYEQALQQKIYEVEMRMNDTHCTSCPQ